MKTFPIGGVHPSDNKKWSKAKAIEPMELPDVVNIPLAQHIGAPATALVKKGDAVKVETGISIHDGDIVFGDVDHAYTIITAHYDTCARMLLPNFSTPGNLPPPEKSRILSEWFLSLFVPLPHGDSGSLL